MWLWPKGTFGKTAGTVTLSIGPSIAPAGKDAATLTQEVEAWIEGEVARLGHPNGALPAVHPQGGIA